MAKKVWTKPREYCTHCWRFLKPIWDTKRELWVCPICHHCIVREPITAPPAGE